MATGERIHDDKSNSDKTSRTIDTGLKNPRAMFYKKPIRRDNFKLEVESEESAQEIRRQRLLYYQKKNRDAAFNQARGILEKVFHYEEEYNEEEEEVEEEMEEEEEEELESMEIDKRTKPKPNRRRHRYYANQLMLSEWMLDVPQDFVNNWIVVPCPKGQRTLVVACKGKTKVYNKRGNRLGKFTSALPGGHFDEHKRNCTILDCIWVRERKVYYVLDVLAWSNQSLQNCDAEFRFFWLKSQMQDIPALRERGMHSNSFPILPLPTTPCDSNLEDFFQQLPELPDLDGVLFYHREGHYSRGRTPLVTWLKAFMVPEVLGISLPPTLEERPDGYIDFKQYILSSSRRVNKKWLENGNKQHQGKLMEILPKSFARKVSSEEDRRCFVNCSGRI